jgi:hypothetical protein
MFQVTFKKHVFAPNVVLKATAPTYRAARALVDRFVEFPYYSDAPDGTDRVNVAVYDIFCGGTVQATIVGPERTRKSRFNLSVGS